MIPHFFKIKSRFGLKNPPIGKSELNIGVEEAPDSILTPDFFDAVKNYSVDEFIFPDPVKIEAKDFVGQLVKNFAACKALIQNKLKAGECQVVIGGDHSVTFAAINALLDRAADSSEVGYIQIDSHADMNLWTDSPTKNFHGMYLRPIIGKFDVPEIEALAGQKLPAANMWFIGNLSLDPDEEKFFKSEGIKNTTTEDIERDAENFIQQLRNFCTRYKYLHVSFDVDGMDKSVALATGLPSEKGLLLAHLMIILDVVRTHQNLSFDLVEINPKRAGAAQTIQMAKNSLLFLING
jgi:arginase